MDSTKTFGLSISFSKLYLVFYPYPAMKKQLTYTILMTALVSLFAGTSFSQTAKPSADRKEMLTSTSSDAEPETEALFRYFRMKLIYPKEARSNNIQANLLVLVQVDGSGKGSVEEIIGKNQEAFSDQIIGLFDSYPGKLDEALYGKKVGFPIIFQKHKGEAIGAPSLENISLDKLFKPITVIGYDVVE